MVETFTFILLNIHPHLVFGQSSGKPIPIIVANLFHKEYLLPLGLKCIICLACTVPWLAGQMTLVTIPAVRPTSQGASPSLPGQPSPQLAIDWKPSLCCAATPLQIYCSVRPLCRTTTTWPTTTMSSPHGRSTVGCSLCSGPASGTSPASG